MASCSPLTVHKSEVQLWHYYKLSDLAKAAGLMNLQS